MAAGMVNIPFTALKRFQAARYWIDTATRIREKEIRTVAHKYAKVTKPDKLSCCQNGLEGSQ